MSNAQWQIPVSYGSKLHISVPPANSCRSTCLTLQKMSEEFPGKSEQKNKKKEQENQADKLDARQERGGGTDTDTIKLTFI